MSRPSMSEQTSPRSGEENVPPLPNPEQPPLAPYDPPDPAPQAAAWARALRVIFMESTRRTIAPAPRTSRTNKRGRGLNKTLRRYRGSTH